MAEVTNISWTDHTFNPWVGCTKITPGCEHCYASALNKRWGKDKWGKGVPRRITPDSFWMQPLSWNRKAKSAGQPCLVFCGSMCDWADKFAPEGARDRLWALIRETPNLIWQMLTKRPVQARKHLPQDWGGGYANVALGVTVEDREHGLRRIDTLRNTPAITRFLSIEPLLKPLGEIDLTGIDWVIVGDESGPSCRPMQHAWVDPIRRQCEDHGVAFFSSNGAVVGRTTAVVFSMGMR